MRRVLMAAIGVVLTVGPVWARHPSISDNTFMMGSIADAAVSTKACGYQLNSDKIMSDMLAEYDTFDVFGAEGYGNQLDRAESDLKRNRDAFCNAAYSLYGPSGTKYKNLLRSTR